MMRLQSCKCLIARLSIRKQRFSSFQSCGCWRQFLHHTIFNKKAWKQTQALCLTPADPLLAAFYWKQSASESLKDVEQQSSTFFHHVGLNLLTLRLSWTVITPSVGRLEKIWTRSESICTESISFLLCPAELLHLPTTQSWPAVMSSNVSICQQNFSWTTWWSLMNVIIGCTSITISKGGRWTHQLIHFTNWLWLSQFYSANIWCGSIRE